MAIETVSGNDGDHQSIHMAIPVAAASPDSRLILLNIVSLVIGMFDSLIKALDHPIGVVALGLFEVEAEEGSFLLISFNVNLVTGLGILCTNAIITLMNHLKVSLISQCKCIIISSRILLILLVLSTMLLTIWMAFERQLRIQDIKIGTILLVGRIHNGLYQFDLFDTQQFNTSFVPATVHTAQSRVSPSGDSIFYLWHRRLGHHCNKTITTILQKCNIVSKNCKLSSVCSACQLGKLHKLHFSSFNTVYSAPFDLIVSDL
ncbi:uncharacterized protein [Gossypium hirsutum]|uniref:GAG-pre-integrase domain-containing protein n=1 Tax=Gossypium hirsutum TaxID=3635 RepID=A0ABM2Z311_GOSHI|nr:uncharacterized protein LOC107923811 [Gossypium hirsutum]